MARIDTLTLTPFEVPLASPFRIATMTNHSASGVFISITAGGKTGWGECLPFHAINGENQATVMASLRTLAPAIHGEDSRDLRILIELCESILPAQTTAISGIDMALHDLAAQRAGLPLYRFLGGTKRELPTDLTIGILPPKEAAAKAKKIIDQGHEAIKIKLGDNPMNDAERVATIREVAEDAILRVDANQAYDRLTALHLLESIAELDIQFCEQPVKRNDYQGLAFLHQNSTVPVMADESCFSPSDAFALLSQNCCNLINVKLCKSGGILRAQEIASITQAAFGRCMMGGMAETRLGVTAAAHVASSHSAFHFFDLDAHQGHKEDVIDGGIQTVRGSVVLPEKAGLGARPKQEFLDRFETETLA